MLYKTELMKLRIGFEGPMTLNRRDILLAKTIGCIPNQLKYSFLGDYAATLKE
jgi:hypothetical protein